MRTLPPCRARSRLVLHGGRGEASLRTPSLDQVELVSAPPPSWDGVGDPFKDTWSVAMNPVIKFTTLFGLLAVEQAVTLGQGPGLGRDLLLLFLAASLVFVWRSFYAMRIRGGSVAEPARTVPAPQLK